MITLQLIYESKLESLISRRLSLIQEIESINNQIIDLRRDARRDGVDLDAVQIHNIG